VSHQDLGPGHDRTVKKKGPKALLGKHLRRLRLAAGLATQLALAVRLDGYGEDMVSKVETGDRVPSDDMYAKWLDACGATDLDGVYLDDLLEQARTSKSVVPGFAVPWLNAEADADYLRFWSFIAVPGPLQTYDYACNMFLLGGMDDDAAAESAAARVERRRHVKGPDAKRMTAVLHESVLYRRVGPDEVMAEQMEDLLAASRLPNVIIQVVPDTGYFFGLEAAFDIASGREIPDTLNMITVEDLTTTERAVVDGASALFERIRGHALPIEESRAKIQEALQRWNNQQ
jgi:transcriptional regulator with XRE-family HTH domain